MFDGVWNILFEIYSFNPEAPHQIFLRLLAMTFLHVIDEFHVGAEGFSTLMTTNKVNRATLLCGAGS